MSSVLDAWATVAFLQGEPAAHRVRQALDDGAVICDINLGEVLYTLLRNRGREEALDAVRDLRGALDAEAPDWELTRTAALMKAGGGLSYADSFAVATAKRHRMPLLTGDPEILASSDLVELVDLRGERTT